MIYLINILTYRRVKIAWNSDKTNSVATAYYSVKTAYNEDKTAYNEVKTA